MSYSSPANGRRPAPPPGRRRGRAGALHASPRSCSHACLSLPYLATSLSEGDYNLAPALPLLPRPSTMATAPGCRELPCPVHLRPNWMHLLLLQLALNLPSPSFNRDHHWRTACCSGCRHGCCHYRGHAWPDGHGPYSVKLRAHEGAAWRLQAPTPLLCRRRAPHGRKHDLRRAPLFSVATGTPRDNLKFPRGLIAQAVTQVNSAIRTCL